MKVLVTGITGFIGQNLGVALTQAGHQVVGLSRHPDDCQSISPFPLECHRWDGVSDLVSHRSLDGVEAVIHLAGESIAQKRWTDRRKKDLVNSRVKSAKNLLESLAAAKVSPRVFVSASAVGAYGDRGDEELTEESEVGKGFLAQLTSQWEAETRRVTELFPDCRLVQLRQGLVLGWGKGFLGQVVPIFRLGLGGRLGDGKQWVSFIHIRDLVRLFTLCLENSDYSGVINAVMPEPMQNRKMTSHLAEVLGVRASIPAPSIALKLGLGEMSQLLLSSQRVLPQRLKQLQFEFEFKTFLEAVREELGIYSRGLEQYEAHQWVPESFEGVTTYFKDDRNYLELLPRGMKTEILSKQKVNLEGGIKIRYNLDIEGLPTLSHYQVLLSLGGGTLIQNTLEYKISMGRFGRLVRGASIENRLGLIFSYRRKQIESLFQAK